MEIREAGLDDLDVIVRFNREMARETEGRELDPATLRAGVNALLSDPARGRYYLAEDSGAGGGDRGETASASGGGEATSGADGGAGGGEAVGQVLVTTEWSDWRNGEIWWIQNVYVAPAHRRRGVYSALHRHVRGLARRFGAAGLRLYVDRENRAARRGYEELGMERARYGMYEEIWAESG